MPSPLRASDPPDLPPTGASELERFAERLERQARELLELAHSLNSDLPRESGKRVMLFDDYLIPGLEPASNPHRAYRERRMRDEYFGQPGLFGEPAWDILLDLTQAEMAGRKLSVTSACIGACVPPTTALRWLAVLEQHGLVERESDSNDGRRAFVRLSDEGIRKMTGYFEEIGHHTL